MGGRTGWVLAAAVGVVLVGCTEQSRVDPDAAITVAGSALAADGSPLAGRPVRLGAGITESEAAFAVLTVGLSCTTGECTGDVFDTTTADDGTYELTLRGADTQSTFGEAVSELLSVTGAPGDGQVSGALASARFRIQTERVQLPTLRLVDPGVAVEAPADVQVRWDPDAPGPYDLTFEEVSAVPVWQVRTGETTATVDARILEDTAGRIVVGGGQQDRIEGSDVELRWRSPGVGYASGLGAPPSRGRPCGDPAVPCALTDGDLVTPAPPSPTPVVITLGEPVPAELVVVRGCPSTCSVETSADGQTFAPAPAASSAFATVPLDGRPITAVRIGSAEPGSGLREVSVWGPRPDVPALRPVEDADVERFASGDGGGGDDDDLPWPLLAAAAVLVVGVAVGVGVTIGRRRAT